MTQAQQARAGKLDAARGLERYLGLRPEDAGAMAEYALLLADRVEDPKRFERVFLALERALRLDPDGTMSAQGRRGGHEAGGGGFRMRRCT